MSDWRDYVLQHFEHPAHRLTLVADPDELLLEERVLSTLRDRGFQLLQFDDPVRFRFAYESRFRQKWDRREPTELVVVLRSAESTLDALPYDLWQAGRRLSLCRPTLLRWQELDYYKALYDNSSKATIEIIFYFSGECKV